MNRNELIKNRAHIVKISRSLSFGVDVVVVTVFPFSITSLSLLRSKETKMLGTGKKVIKTRNNQQLGSAG